MNDCQEKPEALPICITAEQDRRVREMLCAYFNCGGDSIAFKAALEPVAILYGIV